MRHFKNAIFALFAACLLTAVVGVAQANSEPVSIEADMFNRLTNKAIALNKTEYFKANTTVPLGLGDSLTVQQIIIRTSSEIHVFNVTTDGSGRYILFSKIDGEVYVFALDAQRHPTAAAIRVGDKLQPVAIDSVHPQLMRMMAFWIEWAAQNTTK